MKNKKHKIFYGIMLLLFAVGCGKKEGETISDNMALGNTGSDIINFTGSLSDNMSGELSQNGIIDLSGSVSLNVSADMAGVSSDSMSGNLSGNEVGGDALVDPESSMDNVASSISSNDLLAELGVYSNCIYIANMSGKDIDVLTLIFSEGEVRGGEILGGKVLKDGELFTYAATDIKALQEATGLKLTVTATAKDGTVMAFPEVRVINPSGCTVVLSRGQSTSENQAGYEVYIE
ncbi:MAG: hypothetical protein K2K20_06585 [Lachnospiraceae bacterium]|nr:hypothetical protein [Lachnospiraceae bacterium]